MPHRRRTPGHLADARDFHEALLEVLAEIGQSGPAPREPWRAAAAPFPAATPVAAPLAATSPAAATDPFYAWQWHLRSAAAGIDVETVWSERGGRGVRVGIIDDGFQHDHPELDGTYRADLDRDFADRDGDAAPVDAWSNHGTAVAGVIGAEAGNGAGGAGVAWGADLVGLRVSFGTSGSTVEIGEALRAAGALDVVNSSWGYGGFFGDNFAAAAFSGHGLAMEDAARLGRGGLGTVLVFAAGNDRAGGQNVNYHDFQNSPHAVTVAATDEAGAVASFSTPGAAVLVGAPGVNIVSTDRTGAAGYTGGDAAAVSGTSFAAPVVSGVVALMLEAAPALGYRDVQEILAYSARETASFSASARANGAADWNGGGLTFNHDLGFGLVDAHAAVRLAESWGAPSNFGNAVHVFAASAARLAVADNGTAFSVIRVGAVPVEIDRVEIALDISHGRVGDLVVSLVSPAGTESVLVDRPGVSASSPQGSGQTTIRFTTDSVHFWGESVAGNWTLKVRDAAAGHSGVINSWRMEMIGDAAGADDTYVYTDAFATLGASPARAVLRDADGGADTLNLGAIRDPVRVDLAPGAASALLGRALTIDAGTWIENVVAGDGADAISGNALANRISGGRGADVLRGGGGADVFAYHRLADRGDVISDFGPDDFLDLDELFAGLGYRGADPFADGWASAPRRDAGTAVLVDPDGAAGAAAAVELAFLQNYGGTLAGHVLIA